MKKLFRNFFTVFIIALTHPVFSQDSLNADLSKKRLVISACITPSIFYLEPGMQFQYFLKENSCLELKYGFLLFGCNDFGNGFVIFDHEKNWNVYGSIIRFGYLRKVKKEFTNDRIHEVRVTYKDLFFPAYIDQDNSYGYGSSYTRYTYQSEKRRMFILNYITGKKIYENGKCRIEQTLVLGASVGKRDLTQYYYYLENSPPHAPLNNLHVTKNFIRPSLGFGWTFYFKAYEKNQKL